MAWFPLLGEQAFFLVLSESVAVVASLGYRMTCDGKSIDFTGHWQWHVAAYLYLVLEEHW
jgi:hypothetical protein